MYTGKDIFEDVTILNTSEQSKTVVQALEDYIGQFQHMTGVWELTLYQLRLEVDGESAEIGGIHQFALEKPSVWEVGVEPDAGVLWRSNAPLMLLLKQAKRGRRIRFVADYSATVEEKIDYGCSYWEYFWGNHDTPVLRKHTAYRCIEDSAITDVTSIHMLVA